MLSFVPQAYARVDMTAFGRVMDPIINNIVNPIVMLMFSVAVVVFAYGIFEMIWKGGDPDARAQGRTHMIGGVIGMFIMLSAWGIINLIANTLRGL